MNSKSKSKMKFENLLVYLINTRLFLFCLLLLFSCQSEKVEIKRYGNYKTFDKEFSESIVLSEFDNFGALLDELNKIACQNKVPYVKIKKKRHNVRDISFNRLYCC